MDFVNNTAWWHWLVFGLMMTVFVMIPLGRTTMRFIFVMRHGDLPENIEQTKRPVLEKTGTGRLLFGDDD